MNSVLILASVLWTQSSPVAKPVVAPGELFASRPTVAQPAANQAAKRKMLDHSVYDQWKSIRGTTISNDGNWIAYAIAAQEGDMILEVQNTANGSKFSAPIGQSLTLPQGTPVNPRITISGDSKFLVATVNPKWEEYKKARKDKVKPADLPKTGMLIVDLAKSEGKVMEKVSSWQMAPEDQGYLLYKPEVAPTPPAAPTKDEPAKDEAKKDAPKKKADHKPGETYTIVPKFEYKRGSLLIEGKFPRGAGCNIACRELPWRPRANMGAATCRKFRPPVTLIAPCGKIAVRLDSSFIHELCAVSPKS
jgi:hypothetical protein